MPIIGTIVTIKEFFSNTTTEISVTRGAENICAFVLNEGREYEIPFYQREIRWKKENLNELLYDIKFGEKFLGNIIVDKISDSKYQIIDGQQRLTIILLLYTYLMNKYRDNVEQYVICPFVIKSFSGFSELLKNNFIITDPQVENAINASDDYRQKSRYVELWNEIENSGIISDGYVATALMENIERSAVNVILNNEANRGIDYFLDVNLKGVKLDTEDIFKGYLFNLRNSLAIQERWKNLKSLSEDLNNTGVEYPMMKLIEHYLYCNLYKNEIYKNITFGQDFVIRDQVQIEQTRFYPGQHIIKIVNGISFWMNSIDSIIEFLKRAIGIIEGNYSSEIFRNLFNEEADINDKEQKLIYIIISKLLRGENVVPKLLLLKYITDIIQFKEGMSKEDYRKIYGIYVVTTYFNLFETKKNSDTMTKIVRTENWYTALCEQIKGYTNENQIGKGRVTAQFKYLVDAEEEEEQKFQCQALAAIYNYFQVKDNLVKIRNVDNLIDFFENNREFSLEHFIINNSAKCKIMEQKPVYNYPSKIRKYRNSIFNYIFISSALNRDLDNKIIKEKLDYLVDTYVEGFNCEYSKMIITLIKSIFTFPELGESYEEKIEVLDNYFDREFTNQYFEFANAVIGKIAERINE